MSRELRRTTTPPLYIHKFMEAVYPEAPDLAIASFDEEKVLCDATKLIAQLTQTLAAQSEDFDKLKDRLDHAYETIDTKAGENARWTKGRDEVVAQLRYADERSRHLNKGSIADIRAAIQKAIRLLIEPLDAEATP